ncbi:sugar transporter-domain-containing protein [Xylariomycetidae sp. FL2044]|nr:sugar transporter-domain-containing protein [Xylariomycetidae sp. FL2044]
MTSNFLSIEGVSRYGSTPRVSSAPAVELKSLGGAPTRPSDSPFHPSQFDKTLGYPQDHAVPDSVAQMSNMEVMEDAHRFATESLEMDDEGAKSFVRAALVAKDIYVYDMVARGHPDYVSRSLPVKLERDELDALRDEKDRLFSERKMIIVSVSVAIAALLQGHVQSSINGGAAFPTQLGFGSDPSLARDGTQPNSAQSSDWALGATNAMPYLVTALAGVWVATPVNDRLGRRGAIMVSAVLVLVSSVVSALCLLLDRNIRWKVLIGVRVVNGLGMGIKAVSTPILASETAIRFFRGSFTLAWQLWVAFGIMVGFLINLILYSVVKNEDIALALILGAPSVPALALLCTMPFCPESPRYYMRKDSLNYNPKRAFEGLSGLRDCQLLAMKDMYILNKTIEEEYKDLGWVKSGSRSSRSAPNTNPGFLAKFSDLLSRPRLRNALISSGIVNLAQQLCGINVSAFYSSTLFASVLSNSGSQSDDSNNSNSVQTAMGLSLGFGLVNFLFGLPAIKTIDSLGRRKWLLSTLPLMSFFMLMACLSFPIDGGYNPAKNDSTTARLVAMWLYLHAVAYSPGLGPIPITLASESFPLSHREIGCAFSVAVCYGFAGILSLCFPSIMSGLSLPGSLGLFSGLTLIATVLVFLLVEETKELSLESLDIIFGYPKTKFVRYHVREYLPWLYRRYILRVRPTPERPFLDVSNVYRSMPPSRSGESGADLEREPTRSDYSSIRTTRTNEPRN